MHNAHEHVYADARTDRNWAEVRPRSVVEQDGDKKDAKHEEAGMKDALHVDDAEEAYARKDDVRDVYAEAEDVRNDVLVPVQVRAQAAAEHDARRNDTPSTEQVPRTYDHTVGTHAVAVVAVVEAAEAAAAVREDPAHASAS